jgi:integrase/recombinase XerD
MQQYDALIESYIKRCEARNIGKSTIYTRRREIEKFGLWVKRKKPRPKLEKINSEIILDYLKSQSVFRARSTVQAKFSNLRCFFDFLVENNVWHRNPLKWIQGPKVLINSHVPKTLNKIQVEALLKAVFETKENFYKIELPTVFLCLYSLGLRRGEVCNLNIDDWNAEEKTLRVTNLKSQFERYMPIPDSLQNALEVFIPIRKNMLIKKCNPEQKSLFINKFGKRISGNSVSNLLTTCAKKAKIENFTVHQLRHTCATNLISSGVSLPEVKLVLGHSTIDTTLRYTHVAGPERWEAIKKHPLNNFLKTHSKEECL